MHTISRSSLVMYSSEEMYQLVNDVMQYPLFLPNCTGAEVLYSDAHRMQAALEVSKLGAHYRFVTENTLIPNSSIRLTLVKGPFKHLEGEWTFTRLDETACKIMFNLNFAFKNKLTEILFGKIFNDLAGSMVHCFSERAKVVYGKRN